MDNKYKKILWISPFVPYDKVPHAGGKVHNYYIKYLKKNLPCEIELLTLAKKSELKNIDLDYYKIKYHFRIKNENWCTVFFRSVLNLESTCNPFQKFGGGISNFEVYCFKKLIKLYLKENKDNAPNIIIMQWTQAGLMIEYLKNFFPDSKYIIIEEDVSFQGKMRKVDFTSNFIIKRFRNKRAKIYKQKELNALNLADIVTVNNYKDRMLLIEEKINSSKIVQVSPYFDDMTKLKIENRDKNIIFYGAMNRKENYLSAIWFIEKVFFQLEDPELRFLIIGGNPNKQLLKYESERIKVIGFVDNIGEYFKNGLCLVAPMLLGAGIKVKVLEALSAGIPVITNEIGAEGIGITDRENYLHCDTPADYIAAINSLKQDPDLQNRIGKKGKQFIIDHFNIDKTLDNLIDRMVDFK